NRAFITAIGLGANRVQDAVYPTSLKDAEGKAYDGANKYIAHFPKGQLPPVRGFWSITMYDANYFFVANPINRYSIKSLVVSAMTTLRFDKEKTSREPIINFEEARVFDLAQDAVLPTGLSRSTKAIDVRNCPGLCIQLVETGIVRHDGPQIRRRPI